VTRLRRLACATVRAGACQLPATIGRGSSLEGSFYNVRLRSTGAVIRTTVVGNIDALRLARNDSRFVPTPVRPIWMRAKYQILPAWLDYVANVSTADWAVSLESATYLLWLVRRMAPSYLLDTGSGFSSYVFRRYQKEQRERRVVVVSVDSSPAWLEATATFLEQHELATEQLMSWDDFRRHDDKLFDFVFHDLGPNELRIATLPELLREVRADAPVIIDDGQFKEIADGAREAVRGTRRPLYSLRRYTADEVGRFALLVGRAAW
jgi:predicted O-methyltransferase YrrM